MTRKRDAHPTVTVEVWQQGDVVVLDWSVYRGKLSEAMKRRQAHRRVMVRLADEQSATQLTVLAGRMVNYVLTQVRGHQFVPRHLPWQDVSNTEWSVPPGGGEGGESRSATQTMTERLI